ncbi:MAG TPA: NAD(P)/FAD-dependent oxidoreductase [Gaiellaceae bacterium]|nr:NAD(P)/FAD-dependent oxidoreductase [Gaiellaceae bacterium]
MGRVREHDVVIVGARVAGASLAILLARQGRSVLLLDREEFPSDTLSTHYVHPFGVANLARLGLLDDLLAAGFRRLTRIRTHVEDCLFEAPVAPAGGFGLAPRRSVLDALLQEHAVAAGAELLTRTRAEGLVEEDGRVVGVVATDGAGERRELRARLVVGADGKTSKFAEWVSAAAYREMGPLRPVYYGYYRGVTPLQEPAVELYYGGDTIGFLFPMRESEDCLALEVQPAEFDEFRADPQGAFEERYRALHGMEARFRGATLEGKLQGTKGVANFLRVPYGPGWALTGDAAYLKDPVTGFGIGDAVAQALMLARPVGTWLDGSDWEATMSAYHAKRDETLLPLYELTLGLALMQDPPPETIDRLRGFFAMASNVRTLAHTLPANLATLLPPGPAALVEQTAELFAQDRAGASSP